MTDWKQEISPQQPPELQVIGNNLYMERKNIREVEVHPIDEGQEPYTQWESDSREITFDEYHMLKSIEAIDTQAAIDDYTLQLIQEGVIG